MLELGSTDLESEHPRKVMNAARDRNGAYGIEQVLGATLSKFIDQVCRQAIPGEGRFVARLKCLKRAKDRRISCGRCNGED
jgi:hypothetical protein